MCKIYSVNKFNSYKSYRRSRLKKLNSNFVMRKLGIFIYMLFFSLKSNQIFFSFFSIILLIFFILTMYFRNVVVSFILISERIFKKNRVGSYNIFLKNLF